MLFVYLIAIMIMFTPFALLFWFIHSLVRYIKAPKDTRMQYRGTLIASSAMLIVFIVFAIWLSIIGTHTISLM